MAVWNRFFGNAASSAAGFAIGTAVGPTLVPIVHELEAEAWAQYQSRRLDAALLAQGVAQGQVDRAWATNEAEETGVSASRFGRLVAVFDTGPGVAQAFTLWRRGAIDLDGFRRALKREGLEAEWIAAMEDEHDVLLTPAELANARQQGFVDTARQHAEAAKQGVTADRADIQFELSGLPPGVETGLEMLRRGIVTEDEFGQIVREGHTKTKYIDEYLATRWRLLSASQWATLWLKGHATEAQAKAGGALVGYDGPAMDRLYLAQGRPATTHQIHIGYARGAKVPGASGEDDAIKQGVAQSNVRPEYFDVLNAGKYTYPSGFQIKGEAQAGTITQAETEALLLESGWLPKWAAHFSQSWSSAAGGSSGSSYGDKAKAQLWARTHSSYLASEINKTDARSAFAAIGVPTDQRDDVLATWDRERALIRKQLTPAQIKKAFAEPARNPATGGPWTRDEALARLIDLGYSPNDANTFLEL